MHAERLLYSTCVQRLVLIAQAVFFLERGQTDRHTNKQTDKQRDATERPTHAGVPEAVNSNLITVHVNYRTLFIFLANVRNYFCKHFIVSHTMCQKA